MFNMDNISTYGKKSQNTVTFVFILFISDKNKNPFLNRIKTINKNIYLLGERNKKIL